MDDDQFLNYSEYHDRCAEDVERDTILLEEAIGTNNIEQVRRLIPLADPAYLPQALYLAASWAVAGAVEALIAVADPVPHNSRALQAAAEGGSIKCVELLIPLSTNRTDNSAALFEALWNGHLDIMDLLYPHCCPQRVLDLFEKRPARPYIQPYLEHFEQLMVHDQRKRLAQEVGTQGAIKTRKL